MTPLPIDHIVFLILAVVFPIWNFVALRKRAALIRAGRTELRMGLYRWTIGEEWLTAFVLLAGWFALGRGGAALGLVPHGGVLALLYGLTGSLWAPMVVHAVMDITSGRMAYAASTQNDPDSSLPELAA